VREKAFLNRLESIDKKDVEIHEKMGAFCRTLILRDKEKGKG
jgi:hypothetical protein